VLTLSPSACARELMRWLRQPEKAYRSRKDEYVPALTEPS